MKKIGFVLALAFLCAAPQSRAQLRAPNEMGVSMGHWHTIVRDVDATKKSWTILSGRKPWSMETA